MSLLNLLKMHISHFYSFNNLFNPIFHPADCLSLRPISRCPTIFPYEGEAQLEHLACIAVSVARAEAGQKLWRHAADGRVDVDGGQDPVALTQQAVEHQQGQGRL